MAKRGYKTLEAAIEAWNTWPGRYHDVTPQEFRKANSGRHCAGLLENGCLRIPEASKITGHIQMYTDGSFETPWPFLSGRLANSDLDLLGLSLTEILALRARWCALFPSVGAYRAELSTLLRDNDRNNSAINRQLRKWNKYLGTHGFPTFEENDLRGVNLGGLELSGKPHEGIWLRHINLSFSECSVVQLIGVNLYGANLRFVHAYQANLQGSICATADLTYSDFAATKFDAADLHATNLAHANLFRAQFTGAKLSEANLSASNCTDCDFRSLSITSGLAKTDRRTDLTSVRWDTSTRFNGALIDAPTWRGSAELLEFILSCNQDQGPQLGFWKRLMKAIQLRPGWFGISVDLRQLFRRRRRNVD